MCTQSDLGLCVDALGALSLQLPPTTQLHKERIRGRGGEARLMSNSSAWPLASFLAELRETERKKLNSCCAIHAAVYSHTAETQNSVNSFPCLLLASLIAALTLACLTDQQKNNTDKLLISVYLKCAVLDKIKWGKNIWGCICITPAPVLLLMWACFVSLCSTLARPSPKWAPSGSSCTCTMWPAKARRLCCSPKAPGSANCRRYSRWANN